MKIEKVGGTEPKVLNEIKREEKENEVKEFQQIVNQNIEKNKKTTKPDFTHYYLNQIKHFRNIEVDISKQVKPFTKRSDYDSIISEMAKKYNVDENLIKRVIQAESSFNPEAVSRAGAMGLMQLMPRTAKSLGVNDPFNPRENIEGGVKYLRNMLDKYNGDVRLALAAYNAGPGNVDKHGGVPPFKETQNYIRKILL